MNVFLTKCILRLILWLGIVYINLTNTNNDYSFEKWFQDINIPKVYVRHTERAIASFFSVQQQQKYFLSTTRTRTMKIMRWMMVWARIYFLSILDILKLLLQLQLTQIPFFFEQFEIAKGKEDNLSPSLVVIYISRS